VFEQPRQAEPERHQGDGAPALEPERPAEKRPPQDDRHRGKDGTLHPLGEARESGHGNFDSDPAKPQQQHGNHAGPQPEQLRRSPFVGLSDGHIDTNATVECEACRSARDHEATHAGRRELWPWP
jgi:hypothetical protein